MAKAKMAVKAMPKEDKKKKPVKTLKAQMAKSKSRIKAKMKSK